MSLWYIYSLRRHNIALPVWADNVALAFRRARELTGFRGQLHGYKMWGG